MRASAIRQSTYQPEYTAELERRLDDGYARIEHARQLGQDVTAWEDFWIDLLHQYETVVDSQESQDA